ncbi:hypothetical protein D3C75_912060 [compost metagenome]
MPFTANSRSASSKTITGALPPNSSDSFLMVGAHCAINKRPVSVEPVKLSLRTVALRHSSPPISLASPVITCNNPCGKPASSASFASASAVSGVCSAGFMIIAQPAASAGATLRVIIAAGKFHGVIAAQTPTGCLETIKR